MNFVGRKRKNIERKEIVEGAAAAGASTGINTDTPACCAQPDKDAAEPNGFLISGTMRRM